MRVQFYPSPDLEAKLRQEAAKLGVTLSVVVVDALQDYYGLTLPNTLSEAVLEKNVLNEVESFVQDPQNSGVEFDLNQASPTYSRISMTNIGRPKIVKARIGKTFAKKVGHPPFHRVQQVFLANGKIKRSVGNRAALYFVR